MRCHKRDKKVAKRHVLRKNKPSVPNVYIVNKNDVIT